MVMCNGCLVLHRDGEIAYCSEELDGNDCAGYELPHLAGVMACRVTPRGSRCQHCDQAMQIPTDHGSRTSSPTACKAP